jgi:hypothetical protein
MRKSSWMSVILVLCCAGALLGGCDNGVTPQACLSQADCDVGEYCNLLLGVCVPGVCPRDCAGKECGLDSICGESCGTCTAPDTCTAATGQCECAPVCTGLECGPDPVCGASCGTCDANESCDADGICQGGCVPNCANKECGTDGCSGSCGTCGADETCGVDGVCQACTADCTDKACGDDGCGGSCGSCQTGEVCNANFQCQAVCTPDCLGKACGPDGCGGSCGTCDAGAGEVCVVATGACVVCTPDCTNLACGPDPTCGASCGDCQNGETCLAGTCTCVGDCLGLECGDDGCGGSCGDCLPNESCNASGICECTPECGNRVCGLDPVCGFSCGSCDVDEVCTVDGTCLANCTPDCANRECGPEPTCQTSCGTCQGGETCNASGQCACTPNCVNKTCGDDGCGGSCGTCQAPQTCDANGACVCVPNCANLECGVDPVCGQSCGNCTLPEVCHNGACGCVPDCGIRVCGNDPVCNQSCGTCPNGETCDANGQCQSPGGQLGDPCPYNNVNATAPVCDEAQNLFCVGADEDPTYACSVEQDCVDIGFPANYNPDCVTGATTGCGFSFCSQLCDANGACPAGFDPYTDAQGNCFCLPACVPSCAGRECGDDGCGGSCGQCQVGEYCDANFQCQVGQASQLGDPCPYGNVNATAPDCDVSVNLFCVGMPEDAQYTCAADADCLAWGFPSNWNPDCVVGATSGCGASFCSQLCDANGACPAGYDPYTDAQGNCFCLPGTTCTPDCTGRVCGDDGCGGTCGSCVAPLVCDATGQCVTAGTGQHGDLCTDQAQCSAGLVCILFTATDGYCSGVCNCADSTGCPAGLTPPTECMWSDGGTPATCYCGYQCPNGVADCPNGGVGWLCQDVGGFMGCIPGACQPNCAGKACGDDGCGGSCGTCAGGETCNASGQCIPGGCTDIILDPSFESGSSTTPWAMTSTAFGTPLCDPAGCGQALARTGNFYLWMGGGAVDDADAQQSVVIPTGTATLSVYIFINGGVAADYFQMTVDGVEVVRVLGTDVNYATDYTAVTADVSAYANGAAHMVRLHGVVSTASGSILVDDAGLLSCGGACTPNCTGRVCGPDPVCGQSCGTCPGGQTCNASGQCGGVAGRLMLSEVLYDVTGSDDGLEWVEIFNGTAAAIDLSTYSLGNGGNNYLGSVVQLSGSLPAGGCFVVGGPNGGFTYNQVYNFNPDFENSGAAADGVALFNVPAASITANTVPIDAVIYGTTNSNNLLDETGVAGNVDVGDAAANQSIERTGAGWAIQATPTPTVCHLP